jgi:hypothetical protein
MEQIALLEGITGLTDESALITSGNLGVASGLRPATAESGEACPAAGLSLFCEWPLSHHGGSRRSVIEQTPRARRFCHPSHRFRRFFSPSGRKGRREEP